MDARIPADSVSLTRCAAAGFLALEDELRGREILDHQVLQ
jgi:hypothetical protein